VEICRGFTILRLAKDITLLQVGCECCFKLATARLSALESGPRHVAQAGHGIRPGGRREARVVAQGVRWTLCRLPVARAALRR
jgi:hypothetical protein